MRALVVSLGLDGVFIIRPGAVVVLKLRGCLQQSRACWHRSFCLITVPKDGHRTICLRLIRGERTCILRINQMVPGVLLLQTDNLINTKTRPASTNKTQAMRHRLACCGSRLVFVAQFISSRQAPTLFCALAGSNPNAQLIQIPSAGVMAGSLEEIPCS